MKKLLATFATTASMFVFTIIAVVQPACLGPWFEPEELNHLEEL